MSLSKVTNVLRSRMTNFKVGFSAYMHRSPVFRIIVIRYPQLGGGLMSAVKAAGADYFAQTQIEGRLKRKEDPNYKIQINWTRNFLFQCLGFVHGGFINYFMHSILNPFLFGTKKDIPTVVKSILFTQLVYTPCFAFPLFYAFRGFVYNNYSATEAKKSVQLYLGGNWKTDIPMAMKIWAPAHTVTYTLIPLRYRIYWVNVVSFVWTTILSTSRGVIDDEDAQKLKDMSNKNNGGNSNNNNNNNNKQLTNGNTSLPSTSSQSINNINKTNNVNNSSVSSNGMGGNVDANNNIIDPGNSISPPIRREE